MNKKKEDLKIFDADQDYWTKVSLKLSKTKEWDEDREKAWRRPLYGAFMFGIGFFVLLTGAELYPHFIEWMALIALAFTGACGMGFGLYLMST